VEMSDAEQERVLRLKQASVDVPSTSKDAVRTISLK
jgi:hypothetical protein